MTTLAMSISIYQHTHSNHITNTIMGDVKRMLSFRFSFVHDIIYLKLHMGFESDICGQDKPHPGTEFHRISNNINEKELTKLQHGSKITTAHQGNDRNGANVKQVKSRQDHDQTRYSVHYQTKAPCKIANHTQQHRYHTHSLKTSTTCNNT